RPVAGQATQRAVSYEWRDTDDGVMSPVESFAELEKVHARDEDRAVYAVGELLDARVKRVMSGRAWRSLDDSRIGVGFHHPQQGRQTLTAHHTVGIQHYHIAVVAPPSATEVRDVAALALDPMLAPAVKHAPEPLHCLTEIKPRAG